MVAVGWKKSGGFILKLGGILISTSVAQGFAIIPDVFNSDEIETILQAISAVGQNGAVRNRGGVFAIRNLLDAVPQIAALAASAKIRAQVDPVLGRGAFPVRGILFDKTTDANWLVPWHQDLTISVKERADVAGYGPWTIKAGVNHVQPPVAILESMLSVRLHLDNCDDSNGPLRVLPGTHLNGRLTAADINEAKRTISPLVCSVGAGGIVLIRPLVLHSSSSAEHPKHRRVVHIDFASCELAPGLKWFTKSFS